MYFAHIALAAACFVVLVDGQGDSAELVNDAVAEDDTTDVALIDNHTFVALIDIVFTDGTKRTCTGSIIHDNVIITAAHCFKLKYSPEVKPELTASFAVIGTKNMFDTGYEQYLPIERILTHPKYKGWTADLSLVYTFAAMTSDKPGTIIPLAGEKTSTHVDSNVTILSWGHLTHNLDVSSIEQPPRPPPPRPVKQHYHDEEEPCYSDEQEYGSRGKGASKKKVTATLQKKLRNAQGIPIEHPTYSKEDEQWSHFQKEKRAAPRNTKRKPLRGPKHAELESSIRENLESLRSKLKETRALTEMKRYHSAEPEKEVMEFESDNSDNTKKKTQARRRRRAKKHRKETATAATKRHKSSKPKSSTGPSIDLYKKDDEGKQKEKEPLVSPQIFSFRTYYKNWRRQMGTQQNQLIVENFGFVNIQACKLLVEKSMPVEYDISKSNDVICYASGNRFINDDDSGAPAVRHGALVAVTVGGAECDGDHVAVGMKMSCYCSWIADNLPSGGKDLNCCKNCCDVKHKEEIKNNRRHKFKNRYL